MRARVPDDHGVRVAKPEEVGAFKKLVSRARVTPEPELLDAIRAGAAGDIVLEAAEREDRSPLRTAAQAVAQDGQIVSLFARVSLPLVATDEDGAVLGVLQGIAPGNLASELLQMHRPLSSVASLAIRVGKISAVAVRPDATRRGVGTALLHAASRIYFKAGYQFVYGYFRKDDDQFLAAFYRHSGFEITSHPNMRQVAAEPYRLIDIGPFPDQKMFSQNRSAWRSLQLPSDRRLG